MKTLAQLLVLFVSLLHFGFLALETFLWKKPVGLTVFRMTPERATATAALAANQGLYNGFLAAGLLAGLLFPDPARSLAFQYFFLGCVIVAGVFGALTANRSILFIQALPGAIALLATLFAQRT